MKLKAWMIVLILLFGCSPKQENKISILSPFGAPSIPWIEAIKEDRHDITLVSGTDLLLAGLINQNPTYDFIVAPINMGVGLLAKNQTDYLLLGILTWGNLYIVGQDTDDLLSDKPIAMFGKDAVPEKIVDYSIGPSILTMQKQYFPSMLDTQAQLLTKQMEVALLAEPLVSATLAQNKDLKILIDVQQQYRQTAGFDNYPQAAIFVLKSYYSSNKNKTTDLMQELMAYTEVIKQDPTILKNDLDTLTPSSLGLPPSSIVISALERMHVDVMFAYDVQDEIVSFMKLFDIDLDLDMIAR